MSSRRALWPVLAGLAGLIGLAGLSFSPAATAQAAETIRFVSFGDFGTGAQMQYKVAEAIEKKCQLSGCDFAVTLGDNIYNNGVTHLQDSQFQTKFEKPYARLDFRFHMVLGNHDYRGNTEAQIAYTQQSKKWYLPGRYYDFQAGPAHFFALDTNQNLAQQQSHFASKLKASAKPWKIVFGHHPRYTNGYYKNSQSAGQKQLIDSFCGQADIYLSGHEHNKQHLQTGCMPDYLIIGTGGGVKAGARGPGTQFYSHTYGFAWFEVSPTRLTFEILDLAGKVEYRHVMHKK